MAKYLNPKSDLTFKKVFGEHKDLSLILAALYDYPQWLLNDKYVIKFLDEHGDLLTIECLLNSLDRYMDRLMRERTAVNAAERKGRAEGIAIGEERGIAIGEERGIAIGEERERKKAYEEKLASARNLKALGTLTNAEIACALGITEELVMEA